MSPMRLVFSAPISKEDAAKIAVVTGKDAAKSMAWKPETEEDGESDVSYLTFRGPFPEKSLLNVHIPPGLRDISGRSLSNADRFPLPVRTDTYPALAKFRTVSSCGLAGRRSFVRCAIARGNRDLAGRGLRAGKRARAAGDTRQTAPKVGFRAGGVSVPRAEAASLAG